MPDAAMYGVSDGARRALAVIDKGGACRYETQKSYFSVHGNLDMRFVRSLLKRQLIRERQRPRPASDMVSAIVVEAYLTESGRYVLAHPERLRQFAEIEEPALQRRA